jgi:hypothetical protein
VPLLEHDATREDRALGAVGRTEDRNLPRPAKPDHTRIQVAKGRFGSSKLDFNHVRRLEQLREQERFDRPTTRNIACAVADRQVDILRNALGPRELRPDAAIDTQRRRLALELGTFKHRPARARKECEEQAGDDDRDAQDRRKEEPDECEAPSRQAHSSSWSVELAMRSDKEPVHATRSAPMGHAGEG